MYHLICIPIIFISFRGIFFLYLFRWSVLNWRFLFIHLPLSEILWNSNPLENFTSKDRISESHTKSHNDLDCREISELIKLILKMWQSAAKRRRETTGNREVERVRNRSAAPGDERPQTGHRYRRKVSCLFLSVVFQLKSPVPLLFWPKHLL